MARLSPWVFVGIGCLGVAALGVVGIGGVGLLVSKSVREELDRPVDKAATLAALKVPIHPKATFDEPLTRSLRAGTITATKFAKLELTAAAFHVSAPKDEVLAWYQKTLKELGYTQSTGSSKLQFEKGSERVLIDVPEASRLTITRMKVPGTN